jgi:ADP-heptose:LPS heptosyltransferase
MAAIIKATMPAIDFIGQTLSGAAAQIAAATAVVGSDSGLIHLSAAPGFAKNGSRAEQPSE